MIIRGNSYKTTKSYLWGLITSTSYSGVHCWIVDGYLNQQQKVTTKIELIRVSTRQVVSQSTSTYYNYASYLHN
ncbi:MAG: hypothetical protein LBK47_10030, partial [Prevotellaceae bacterium]|nr:hypothetical protein [Prevotellaceae bacterium]